jgi:hypothetical protein
MRFLADQDDVTIKAVLPQSGRGGPASQTRADDDERRRHSDLNHEIVSVDVERIGLHGLGRRWRKYGAGRHVELGTVAPTGHDGPLQRPFCGKRALLVCTGVVDREESATGIGHGDAKSLHVECGKLAGFDVCRSANCH